MKKIAYVKNDIDCQTFTIHEGAVFLSNDNGSTLTGFHHGRTDQIKELQIYYPWMFADKINYYEVPDDCHICKYCDFTECGYECMAYGCVNSQRSDQEW